MLFLLSVTENESIFCLPPTHCVCVCVCVCVHMSAHVFLIQSFRKGIGISLKVSQCISPDWFPKDCIHLPLMMECVFLAILLFVLFLVRKIWEASLESVLGSQWGCVLPPDPGIGVSCLTLEVSLFSLASRSPPWLTGCSCPPTQRLGLQELRPCPSYWRGPGTLPWGCFLITNQ